MNKRGILPVNKSSGCSSFHLVSLLRKRLQVRTIGHAGTLDPFATGVMVLLVDRAFTRLSEQLLSSDKEYRATVFLGKTTDTFDCDGKILSESTYVPTQEEIEKALSSFQGEIFQVPPMFSAKKIGGKKCYELARKGITIERMPVKIRLSTVLIRYAYPILELDISCSKGTYIRSLAQDLGEQLKCGAFLSALTRTRVGSIDLQQCVDQKYLSEDSFDLTPFFRMSL